MQVGYSLPLLHKEALSFLTKNQKLPVVGDYFVREVPPSDNVSNSCSSLILDDC